MQEFTEDRGLENVIVLGAGLQGACAALALRAKGYDVTIVDKALSGVLRASLRNEGKIHLGLVYANDPGFETASLMLESALAFGPAMERMTRRPIDWERIRSRPFVYAIATDSMVPESTLLARYEELQDLYRPRFDAGESYLGRRPERLWDMRATTPANRFVSSSHCARLVSTEEAALDTSLFRDLVLEAMERQSVRKVYGTTVRSVIRTSGGFRVEGVDAAGQTWASDAGIVVNCLWEGRITIDRELGIEPPGSWIYRLKYRLLGELPEKLRELPSLTMVLGPYGDVVAYGQGRVYLSWYPACLRGWSTDLAPPVSWEAACNGTPAVQERREVMDQALSAFDAIVPGLGDCRIDTVDGGIIYSLGESDITDPTSRLHQRYAVGIREADGYFSIDTGKLTCAPLFATKLADMMEGS